MPARQGAKSDVLSGGNGVLDSIAPSRKLAAAQSTDQVDETDEET
jgi:hypothetical protein